MIVEPEKFKVHSLTGRITPKLMMQAFKAVKKNRGTAGLDNISIQMFEKNLDENQNRQVLRGVSIPLIPYLLLLRSHALGI